MEAGLNVFNNSGFLQIDSTYKNIQYYDKSTYVIEETPDPNDPLVEIYTIDGVRQGVGQIDVDLTTLQNVFFALRCEGGFVTWEDFYPTNSYPPRVYGKPIFKILGTMGAVVTLYRFNYAPIPAGNYFEVKNAAGELVFSDTGKFMKILHQGKGNRATDFYRTAANTVFSTCYHSSTTKTAAILSHNCFQRDFDSSMFGEYACFTGFTFNSESTVAAFNKLYEQYGTSPHGRLYDQNYEYLILDVTGL